MTQMLLFDSPATTTPVVPAKIAPKVDHQKVVVTEPTQKLDHDRGGVHHMGDLARLVLMRYELVAKRRAALAARRAK